MKPYEQIVALENEALAAAAEARYETALLRHGWALEIAQTLDRPDRPALMAALFERLGKALEAMGSIQDAVIAYERGLVALDEGGAFDLDSALARIGELGKSYRMHQAQIPDLYSPAVDQDLAAAVADPALAARLFVHQGNAYLQQPQEGPALEAYRQALQRPEIVQAPALRAYARANSGEILRRQGKVQEAETALTEAIDLLDRHGEPTEKRRALALLAGIARERKQYRPAEDLYRQALDLYAQTDDRQGESKTLAGLGHLYLEQGRFDEAQAAFTRALDLVENLSGTHTLWHIHWGLGRCHRAAGQLDEAATQLQYGLDQIRARHQDLRTDEGKVTFLDSVRDAFEELIAVHLDRARSEPRAYEQALEVAEEARGQALRDLMGGRSRRRPPSGIRAPTNQPRPSAADALPPDSMPQLWAEIAPGVPSASSEPMPWEQMAPGISSQPIEPKPWVQMAAAVPAPPLSLDMRPSEETSPESETPPPLARLVFFVLADRCAVWAVTPDGQVHSHTVDWGREALSTRVAELRRALGVDEAQRGLRVARHVALAALPAPTDPRSLLHELYDALIAPVAEALPGDGTPVAIEPHGALWLVPFAALLAPDDTWLADRWPLLYSPSAQVLDEIRTEPDPGTPTSLRALVVGNPTMPEVPPQDGLQIVLETLPGAEEEAHTIAALFGERCTLLTGEQADRATVERLAERHGIVHLATHGVAYADAPLASFVALAKDASGKGLLTARDVLDLSLPADLVVLSACQTALGRVSGDGMIGLCRAFLVAGARAVLVSQWSVSDEATAALMAEFYRAYLAEDNKAVALQRAMRALRQRPQYADPSYWAPFVVVGAER